MPTSLALQSWLEQLEQLDPGRITLGLDRVRQVGERLGVLAPTATVVTVAGTNGKGSSVALLEQTFLQAGLSVAAYTSPHLLRYNERLRLNGDEIGDAQLCESFSRVAQASKDVALSYFEFGTLAVFDIIQRNHVDVAVLEVGMGGRLDAVNVIDSEVALITNIGLDHQAWLGTDRAAIGREKAGIMRADRAVICNDLLPPDSIAEQAASVGAKLICLDQDYHYTVNANDWQWQGLGHDYAHLPMPAMPGRHQLVNAAGVLAVLQQLQDRLPWTQQHFAAALQRSRLNGRMQRVSNDRFGLLLDVAHNTEAASALADCLAAQSCEGRTVALFAALQDKPVAAMLRVMAPHVDGWYLAGLPQNRRGLDGQALRQLAVGSGLKARVFATVDQAFRQLDRDLTTEDRAIVFGSFYTVEAVLRHMQTR